MPALVYKPSTSAKQWANIFIAKKATYQPQF